MLVLLNCRWQINPDLYDLVAAVVALIGGAVVHSSSNSTSSSSSSSGVTTITQLTFTITSPCEL